MCLSIQSRQLLCGTDDTNESCRQKTSSCARDSEKVYHSNMQVYYEIKLPCCGRDVVDISVLKAGKYLRHANAI